MTTTNKMQVLQSHGIRCIVGSDDNMIIGLYACDEYVSNGQLHETWVNVSNWTLDTVRTWLGY